MAHKRRSGIDRSKPSDRRLIARDRCTVHYAPREGARSSAAPVRRVEAKKAYDEEKESTESTNAPAAHEDWTRWPDGGQLAIDDHPLASTFN